MSDSSTSAGTLRIVIVSSGDVSERLEIPVTDEAFTIGREDSCTLTLNERSVSRRHARIVRVPGGLKVIDLDSGNGVWVEDKRVREAVVTPGQRFRIGSTIMECRSARDDATRMVDVARETILEPGKKPVVSKVETRDPKPGEVPVAAKPRARQPVGALAGYIVRVVRATGETQEVRVEGGVATIGRADSCTVVIPTKDVSRAHAEIRPVEDGFRVADSGSTNGVWVDDRRVEEAIVRPGQKFRIGNGAVLVCEPTERRDAAVSAPVAHEDLVTRVVETPIFVKQTAEASDESQDGEVHPATRALELESPAKKVEEVSGGGETRLVDARAYSSGRGKPPGTVTAKARPSPRSPERAEPSREKPETEDLAKEPVDITRIVDLDEAALASERDSAAKAVAEEALTAFDPSQSIIVPTIYAKATGELSIDTEGEGLDIGAHQPFLIDDPASLWYVVSGGVDIFTVALENNQPSGTRSHFLGILPEQFFFGFDLLGAVSGFLAVGKHGTELRKISIDRLRWMASQRDSRRLVAALIDTWITGLTRAINKDFQVEHTEDVLLSPRERVGLEAGKKASSAEGVLWITISSGEILFNDVGEPIFKEKQALFPVTPDSWVQSRSDEFGPLSCTPLPTESVIARPAFWRSLETFHETVRDFEFVNKHLKLLDEKVRLDAKAAYDQRVLAEARANIAGVMEQGARPKEFLATGSAEPVVRACKIVGESLGMTIKRHPSSDKGLTFEEQVGATATASGFRTRVIALRDDWWTNDHGPLLAQIESTKTPVALLPTGDRTYEIVDPKTGNKEPVTEELAETLAPFGYTFYRPFPDGKLNAVDVVRFGAQGLFNDYRLLILMGAVVGMFGTVTPYITGRIYDAAIPQADRGMLIGFGLALFASAAASSAFKFVQGVATVRIQGRMEYNIQAALWDRLLNLPANFFRQYSSGDLSDRVNGVDRIQQLVSGAGIAAILGSFSGIFYVFQMFTYNMMLALLAVGLTSVFVGTTTVANYMQLRYQRVELEFRGLISGLVLNLVTGVLKLRIAGAENRAFRVWSKAFSDQRKISFKVGTIQNVVTVFNQVFPVASTITIFLVMVSEQQKAAESGLPGLTTGDFIAFSAAYGLFLTAMQAMGNASLDMLRVVPIYERLEPILSTPAEIDSTKVFPGRLEGDIRLSHIHFRYSADGPWIIKDLSLEVKPGEMVAFVGGSGCGKSTLMRLMLGFETPSMGGIYYDGQDLASLDTRMVRQQMGVVLQQSKVMPTEVYRNIIGVSSRTMEEAWDAAEKAGLAEDIRAMPMGMHTYVSEGGGTFSGGQRQRLMIARAIVHKPNILFLDEATSALDNKAQNIVTEAMDRMEASRIVIAHRLSTVINADKICYLDAGRIVESGTYEELMENDGPFAALARRQMA